MQRQPVRHAENDQKKLSFRDARSLACKKLQRMFFVFLTNPIAGVFQLWKGKSKRTTIARPHGVNNRPNFEPFTEPVNEGGLSLREIRSAVAVSHKAFVDTVQGERQKCEKNNQRRRQKKAAMSENPK